MHFVNKDSKGPPVDGASVTFVQEDLRCNVLWSSANCVSSLSDCLREPKIDHFEVAVASNHNILRLQIPVADVLGVEVIENEDDLCNVKPAS